MLLQKKDGQDGETKTRPKAKTEGGGLGLLPPPPGGVKLAPPPAAAPTSSSSNTSPNTVASDSWGDFVASTEKSSETKPSSSGAPAAGWVTF